MARRKTLTDKMVARLKPEATRQTKPDPELRGHYVRITPTGAKSYVAVARNPGGKQVWATLGGADVLTIDRARARARGAIQRIKDGLDPFPPPPVKPDSFKAVAENYIERHVQKNGLISEDEIRRILNRHILPVLGDREFRSIKKSDVRKLLDAVEDDSGARQADYVLSIVRQIMRWQAEREDDYECVITAKLARTKPKDRRRKRKLEDHEIRLVWNAADGPYGAIVKLGLLTGQRRQVLAAMRWEGVSLDGVWTIPTPDRAKGTGEKLPLPDMAIEIIKMQVRVGDNPFIFAGRTKGHFNGYSRAKKLIDERITKANDGEPIPHWQYHDLRRTARSLLSRAGVLQEHAERILGHAQDDIVQTYDLHDYTPERGKGLKKLAGLVAMILDPPAENVTPLRAGV